VGGALCFNGSGEIQSGFQRLKIPFGVLIVQAHGKTIEKLTLQEVLDAAPLQFGIGQCLVGRFKQLAA
jgi:hypothetical protein